jgi:hypothetical protein
LLAARGFHDDTVANFNIWDGRGVKVIGFANLSKTDTNNKGLHAADYTVMSKEGCQGRKKVFYDKGLFIF